MKFVTDTMRFATKRAQFDYYQRTRQTVPEEHLHIGDLVRILANWRSPLSGYHLYFQVGRWSPFSRADAGTSMFSFAD